MKNIIILCTLFGLIFSLQAQNIPLPPGVVINHLTSSTGRYIGSPSICVLPNGDYIASHDEFGPKSSEFKSAISRIFRSTDKGLSWKKISQIDGQFWSTLFVADSSLFIMGTNKHHGNVVLRQSLDKGESWSIPYNSKHGLILEGEYHTAPVPVVVHNGRIWRSIEYATAKTTRWGERYSAAILSAPIDGNLMDAATWTRSNHLYFDSTYLEGNFKAWLEGNIVVDRDGSIKDILRVHVPQGHSEVVAIVDANQDGSEISFNPNKFIKMPGASKKFTIRYDAVSDKYLSLVNFVPKEFSEFAPDKVRNNLALISSKDLNNWSVDRIVLSHPDQLNHGFQYVDWLVEGDDIIFVSRTAFEDLEGGAKNNHDANFLTFHRINQFRQFLK